MTIVFDEDKHPRDALGRFRESLDLLEALAEGATEIGDSGYFDLDAEYEQWHGSLGAEERNGLTAYVGTSNGAAVNGFMRHGAVPADFTPTDSEHPDVSLPTIKGQAAGLDAALSKASLPRGVTTFREFRDAELAQLAMDGNLVGSTVQDRGFMSTSTIPSWDMEATPAFMADAKSGDKGTFDPATLTDPEDTAIFARVRVPKGAHAAPVDRYSAFHSPKNPEFGEHEILLQDGTTAEVTEAVLTKDKEGNQVLILTMDVIRQLGKS